MLYYKYLPVSKYSLTNLAEKKVWFAHPHTFNDPFDSRLFYGSLKNDYNMAIAISDYLENLMKNGQIALHDVATCNMVINNVLRSITSQNPYPRSILEWFLRQYDLYNYVNWGDSTIKANDHCHFQNFREIERELGILALSDRRDSILMWSHYADQHCGICLEFEIDKKNIGAQVHVSKVNYTRTGTPNVIWVENIQNRQHFKSELDNSVITKHQDWGYEQEYRMIGIFANQSVSVPGLHLRGVIFGSRLPPDQQAMIQKIVNITYGLGNVQLYQCRESLNAEFIITEI